MTSLERWVESVGFERCVQVVSLTLHPPTVTARSNDGLALFGLASLKANAHIFRPKLHYVMLILNIVRFHHYDVKKKTIILCRLKISEPACKASFLQ